MYQALYRKYRPTVFEDVVGQPQVTTTLKNELKLERIHHAYVFTGSRGTGKTTCAKILAKAVNCLDLKDSDPCGVCESCVGIDSGEILDVVEMDAASNRGINDVRAIIDEVNFAPAKAKYRVYIIDEAHMITNDAWNALLKTLEEPPSHVVFIFATTEVGKIPPTILSRCQRFDFRRITPEDIAARVKLICEKESITITDEAALLISVIADGALRDALSILDRCVAISSEVTGDVVRRAAGLASNVHLFELCDCIVTKNASKALERLDALYNDSKNMMSLADELLSHLRSLMLIKTVRNPRAMLVMSDREFEAALSQSGYLTLSDIVYYMDVLSVAYARMSNSPNPRYDLEMALVKLCSSETDGSVEALTARVTALEKAVKDLSVGAPRPKGRERAPLPVEEIEEEEPVVLIEDEPVAEEPVQAKPKKEVVEEEPPVAEKEPDAPVKKESPAAPEETKEAPAEPEDPVSQQESPAPEQPAPAKKQVDLEALYENAKPFSGWKDVLSSIKAYSNALYAAFADSNAYISGDYLLIDTDSEIAFKLLRTSSERKKIHYTIRQTTGRAYNLGPYKRPEKKKTDDVLEGFLEKLKDAGVSVSEE